jgi:hypothetical protein
MISSTTATMNLRKRTSAADAETGIMDGKKETGERAFQGCLEVVQAVLVPIGMFIYTSRSGRSHHRVCIVVDVPQLPPEVRGRILAVSHHRVIWSAVARANMETKE